MGAEAIILFNPYTYNFLKGLTHSALYYHVPCMTHLQSADYAKYSHLQGPTFYAKTEVKVTCLCFIKYW